MLTVLFCAIRIFFPFSLSLSLSLSLFRRSHFKTITFHIIETLINSHHQCCRYVSITFQPDHLLPFSFPLPKTCRLFLPLCIYFSLSLSTVKYLMKFLISCGRFINFFVVAGQDCSVDGRINVFFRLKIVICFYSLFRCWHLNINPNDYNGHYTRMAHIPVFLSLSLCLYSSISVCLSLSLSHTHPLMMMFVLIDHIMENIQ